MLETTLALVVGLLLVIWFFWGKNVEDKQDEQKQSLATLVEDKKEPVEQTKEDTTLVEDNKEPLEQKKVAVEEVSFEQDDDGKRARKKPIILLPYGALKLALSRLALHLTTEFHSSCIFVVGKSRHQELMFCSDSKLVPDPLPSLDHSSVVLAGTKMIAVKHFVNESIDCNVFFPQAAMNVCWTRESHQFFDLLTRESIFSLLCVWRFHPNMRLFVAKDVLFNHLFPMVASNGLVRSSKVVAKSASGRMFLALGAAEFHRLFDFVCLNCRCLVTVTGPMGDRDAWMLLMLLFQRHVLLQGVLLE